MGRATKQSILSSLIPSRALRQKPAPRLFLAGQAVALSILALTVLEILRTKYVINPFVIRINHKLFHLRENETVESEHLWFTILSSKCQPFPKCSYAPTSKERIVALWQRENVTAESVINQRETFQSFREIFPFSTQKI